ncbi:MAG: hypothetical protein ACT4OU_00460 [Hyphomicrobium sp.]
MSAEVIELAAVRASRSAKFSTADAGRAVVPVSGEAGARFHFWTGASGKRYVHTVYSLFDCPPLEGGNYVLVRRGDRAKRDLLAFGRLTNETATLNLAEIRQRAAMLGADEVHVHLLAMTAHEAQAVEVDLKSAEFAARAN